MNSFRFIIVSLFVFGVLFLFAVPKPEMQRELETADLPWNIKTFEDGSSEVFHLKLEHSTLQDAIDRFHEPEDIALYFGEQASSLEAYFGTINIGPLEAKMVITLATDPDEINTMLERARGRSSSNSSDAKIEPAHADKEAALQRKITGITFIPKYSGLDADFFKQRLGEPASWLRLSENSVQYFYPDKGLSVTIDAEGKEILQYSAPARFSLPDTDQLQTDDQPDLTN
ncbi:MAG: hypothetical protein PVG66_06280 [Chromatiales bacterium]|jgi:hypothetical protein